MFPRPGLAVTSDGVKPFVMTGARTLPEILQDTAYTRLPSTFHWLLQAGLPLAFQLWTWGWHRAAGWLVVTSAFSVWALAQQRLEGYADDSSIRPPVIASLARTWRIARGLGALVGSSFALALLLEAFAQLMAAVFKCPGCAG